MLTIAVLTGILGTWLFLELAVRLYVDWPLRTDFYGSISRDTVRAQQMLHGVRVATGYGWAHLGWIADPARERYRIDRQTTAGWQTVGSRELGSLLLRESGLYRVWAEPRDGTDSRLIGEVAVSIAPGTAPVLVPQIAGPWQLLFRPTRSGNYVNDHTVYRDAPGSWRVVGITGPGEGDYARETHFAVGLSADFPPAEGMNEAAAVADFGVLAWAPHVIEEAGTYYLFWSPHQLHRMASPDGIHWTDHRIVMAAPVHKCFRDAMVFKVADGQWLLYATARGRYFSRIDVYQSFDLEGWQYIGAALQTGWGSERNALFASTESPNVVRYGDRFYLSLTYNNNSFFWTAILLLFKVWLRRATYNDTLVFHADNPYDFGAYRGRRNAPSLLTRIEAHAPELVHDAKHDAWYITTAGWPWVATLTSGEVAVAPLRWAAVASRPLFNRNIPCSR